MDIEVSIIDNQKGKGLLAKKDFAAGSLIFEEDPLVCCQFAWNEQYGYRACNHCMRPLETAEENARRLAGDWRLLLPYPQCDMLDIPSITSCPDCGVGYCSESCRVNAFNQYHRSLCLQTRERNNVHPLEHLEEAWKELHFPPETCNILMIARIIAMVQQSTNPQECFEMFLKFCHRTVNEDNDLVHKLVGTNFVCQIDSLLEIIKKALSSDGVEPWMTPEGFRSLLALIGTNGQGVATSPISAWVKNCTTLALPDQDRFKLDEFITKLYEDLEKESGSFLDNEGSALYILQSACNHSCDPNAQINFLHNNFRLSMVATKDIKCGEEIVISYLDECQLDQSRHSRQKYLMENYMFKCDCNKCVAQAGDADVSSSDACSDSD